MAPAPALPPPARQARVRPPRPIACAAAARVVRRRPPAPAARRRRRQPPPRLGAAPSAGPAVRLLRCRARRPSPSRPHPFAAAAANAISGAPSPEDARSGWPCSSPAVLLPSGSNSGVVLSCLGFRAAGSRSDLGLG